MHNARWWPVGEVGRLLGSESDANLRSDVRHQALFQIKFEATKYMTACSICIMNSIFDLCMAIKYFVAKISKMHVLAFLFFFQRYSSKSIVEVDIKLEYYPVSPLNKNSGFPRPDPLSRPEQRPNNAPRAGLSRC